MSLIFLFCCTSYVNNRMVITNDFKQYEMLKMVRSNGWDRQLSLKTQRIKKKI